MFRKIFGLLLAILAFGISLSSFADPFKCDRVDLRETKPALKTYFENHRSQGDLDWCWAHAAADVLTYRVETPISASDLAFRALAERFPLSFTEWLSGLGTPNMTGFPEDAFQIAAKYGVCSEEDSPSNDFPFSPKFSPVSRAISEVLKIRELMAQGQAYPVFFEKATYTKAIQTIFPHLQVLEIFDIIQRTSERAPIETFDLLTRSNCSHRRIEVPSFQFYDRTFGSIESKIQDLHRQISRQTPVIISAKMNMLFHTSSTGNHALTIFGRDFLDGKCQFLIRNTWELHCNALKSSFQNHCNNHDGSFWISEDALAPALNRLYYIR